MIYIDTNVIVSYIDEADPNHERALKLIESLSDERVISKLVIIELVSVYARASLEEPLPLAIYSVKVVGASEIDVNFGEVLRDAFVRAPTLKLRTLDLLHIIACKVAGCEKFATLDSDISRKSEEISRELGIEVITT